MQTNTPRVGLRAFARHCIGLAALVLAALAGAAQAQLPSPVFRFYNTQTGTHFYTISVAERDLVLARYAQFAYEGPAYYAYPASQGGQLPVYRFYNTRTGTHFYTQSEAEKDFVLVTYPVFAFEGPAYYAPAGASQGNVPLFRFYNQNTGAHFFTTNAAERDMVLQRWPFFAYEGTAYQVYPTGAATPGVNLPPTAKLTVSPASVPSVPAIVTLNVEASDADGSVMRVEYYSGATKIGETVIAPHSMNYPITIAGSYSFSAIAYDNSNASTSTSTVAVNAAVVANVAPKVTLATSTTSLPAPGVVTLTATATDDDGTIAKVSFYDGSSKIGEVASAPYELAYNAAVAKTYNFKAIATDDKGATGTSATIGVTVGQVANASPKVSLAVSPATQSAPGPVSLTATASDDDGTIAKVAFYQGATKIGEDTSPPYTASFTTTAAGTVYKFTAVATDNLGATGSSAEIGVTVGTANAAPKVTVTSSPANQGVPGPLTLTANASDTDGTIAKVAFYNGGTKISEDTTSPFTATFTTTTTGSVYKFTAVATDDKGLSTTSTELGVTVGSVINAVPKVSLSGTPTSQTTPGTVTLTASPTDSDGTIAKVSFYANGQKFADVLTPPFTTSYTTTNTGTIYKFYAIATDDRGATATSQDVNISVGTGTNNAPKVTLAVANTQIAFPGTATMTATASDVDGTIARVRFYQNGTQRGEVTTPPYTFSYTTTVPGIYKFKAIATDDKGATTSTAEVPVTSGTPTQLNKKPTVSMSLSNTLVMAPATVTLTATASDTDGAIQKVQFYRNGAKIGEKTATPFTYTDTIASSGKVSYHVDATDDVGNVNTTLQQVVSAQVPPAVATTDPDIWRLLNQATFGASQAEAANVKSLGITGWIDGQFAKPVTGYPASRYNRVQLSESADCTTRDPLGNNYPSNSPQAMCVRDHLTLAMMQRDMFTNAVTGGDQLRQRVAWALSQFLVISGVERDLSYAHVMARYQQIMFDNAFGNFENILAKISVSPAMGNWLDSVNNDRPDATKGRVPNENYAREIMQLFSVGLVELKSDGTPLLDANGEPIPTYDQEDIKQFARVFTGWTYANPDGSAITKKNAVYYGADMGVFPGTATTGHDTDAKTLLNGTTLPAGQTAQKDLADAVHNVFVHPNTGPFVAKLLIQRLVTGNPSDAYVGRIAAKFANNGSGVRGDLKAVVRAILLDPEARGAAKADPAFGSLREPVLMITGLVRALNGVTDGAALGDRTSTLGQRPYYAPTVFNYFQPDETIPGTSILAPEFGIHDSNSAVTRTNLVYSLVYSGIAPDQTLPGATGTRLNTYQFDQYATDAAVLTDRVSEMLIGGALPAAARTAVINAVNAVTLSATPTAQQLTDRSRMAVYLIASSYHYQVQR
ncbi:MAG: DUF1800 family protein [Betaproteobacteria bacterium]|nr:DUF1800 family protein [Betaproteobacteria bacterium]